ncbi:velvet factor [Roridomyces roridus]|uniref:Velvet factor n=1 Tax=Roridomyces roridus TaxID=1738132 RepID=A0AAD7C503_9AGAR|nr:velvet factor [Roridomyces roridus]
MIQHISPRKTSTATAVAPMRQSTGGESQEEWGKWQGRNYYSLEMVQHPLRARMCGFGDKDRRPLAPAAVARMVVKREDNSIVDVDDVDCSFFLVTVDLWSEDGKHERNLVLHPSSGDRYVPVQTPKQRRRGGNSSAVPRSGHQTPISRSTPTPSSQYPPPSSSSTYNSNPSYFPAPQSPPMPAPAPLSSYGSSNPSWGYPSHAPPSQVDRNTTYPPPILPSISSFNRGSVSSSPANEHWHPHPEPEPTYRPWNASSNSGFGSSEFGNPPLDPALKGAGGSDSRDGWDQHQSSSYSPAPSNSQYDSAIYGPPPPPPYSHQQPYFPPSASSNSNYPPQSASAAQPNPRSAYTRTLVGPLSSNAYRLLDEHRKPGIFFLFQDLSVRTEGTFRLRLRLMNVGAPPAPEPGALAVNTGTMPVLAQIFSEPFTVYSAKRFPGVPETTALSIAFGNQGLKLPLVNLFLPPTAGRSLTIITA